MQSYVSVLLVICFGGNIVWSVEYWADTSENFFLLPRLDSGDECTYNTDVISEFRYVLTDFASKIYKRIAIESDNHFDVSPISIWQSLAAIAEGSAGNARQELFQLLNLPDDKCLRQQFYTIANSREYSSNGVSISRKRLLVIDENISINTQWRYFVRKNRLFDIIAVPLSRSPKESIDTLRQLTSMQLPNIDLNGNSLLLDTFDCKVTLKSDFGVAKVERVPFYNDFDEEIGTINMIKMKKRVKLAYLPDLKLKVLELPNSENGRYRLFYGIAHGNDSSIDYSINTFKNDMILKILSKLRLSRIPLEIGIPQYTTTTETDVKSILENLGVKTVWSDIWATRNISNPPVFPSSFVQRVTLTFDRPDPRDSVEEIKNFVPAIDNLRNEDTGLDDVIGRDFIVNRPFMLGLLDAEAYTSLLASSFTKLTNV